MTKSLAQAYLNVSLRLPVEDIKVKQRLDRAYEIVNGYGYEITVISKADEWNPIYIYHVEKASTSLLQDTSMCYTVTNKSCTCPDFDTARGNLCKHLSIV